MVQLAAPTPSPLQLRTTDTTGHRVPFALLTLWLDGQRLPQVAMSFATWSRAAMTDGEGMWLGKNLPAGALRVLATKRVTPAHINVGTYDSLSTIIAARASEVIDIRTVE